MSRRNYIKPQVTVREAQPRIHKGNDGYQIMCPFCNPSHPMLPGKVSKCGSTIEVTALQEVISARAARLAGIVCVKCQKPAGGGAMVHWQNGYIHLEDCDPKSALLVEPPKFSRWAKFRYVLGKSRLFSWNAGLSARICGKAQPVKEILPDGTQTGRILGFAFYNVVAAK